MCRNKDCSRLTVVNKFALPFIPFLQVGFIVAVFLACSPVIQAMEQEGGPITLQGLIQRAVMEHPLVQGAAADVAAGGLDVEAAQRRWWPTVSAVMESDTGTNSISPSRALQVEQTIWDGGKTSALVDQARAGLTKSEANALWQKQQLALQVAKSWQDLIGARDKILIAEATLERLHDYEQQMRRRVAANASPAIDLELILSRTRQTEVDLSAAHSSLRIAAQRLEQLSGIARLDARTGELPTWPLPKLVHYLSASLVDADYAALAKASPAVQVAKGETDIVNARLEAKRAEQYPTAYVRLNQPIGDPAPSRGLDNKLAVYVGVRYTPGAGFATGVEADAIRQRVTAADQSSQAAYREQYEAMSADREEFVSSAGRLAALGDAVSGAQQVLDSYSRQFTAGRKSWIDLLNAVRELSQNQFAQAESQAAMTGAFYRLQLRQGHLQLLPNPGRLSNE